MIDIQRNNFTEGRRTRKLYDLPYYKIYFVEERGSKSKRRKETKIFTIATPSFVFDPRVPA